MKTPLAVLLSLLTAVSCRTEMQGVRRPNQPNTAEAQAMAKTKTLNAEEYREVRACELVSQPGTLDGLRIVMMDYVDVARKEVDTPEGLRLALNTAASPRGVTKLLEALGKRLARAKLWGVFQAERRPVTLEVHSIEALPEPPYQRVTWAEVTENPEKYDRARVEYSGQYVSWLESSLLDGVWLQSSPYATRRGEARASHAGEAWRGAKVRVRGVLHTQPGGYGHLNGARFLLRADEIEYLP